MSVFPVTAEAEGTEMTLTARVSDCQDTIAENNEAGCMVAVGLRRGCCWSIAGRRRPPTWPTPFAGSTSR